MTKTNGHKRLGILKEKIARATLERALREADEFYDNFSGKELVALTEFFDGAEPVGEVGAAYAKYCDLGGPQLMDEMWAAMPLQMQTKLFAKSQLATSFQELIDLCGDLEW